MRPRHGRLGPRRESLMEITEDARHRCATGGGSANAGLSGLRGDHLRARENARLRKLTQQAFRQTSAVDWRTELWLETGARGNAGHAHHRCTGRDVGGLDVAERNHIGCPVRMQAVAGVPRMYGTIGRAGRDVATLGGHRGHARYLRIPIMRISNEPLTRIQGEAAHDHECDDGTPAMQKRAVERVPEPNGGCVPSQVRERPPPQPVALRQRYLDRKRPGKTRKPDKRSACRAFVCAVGTAGFEPATP